LGRSHRQGFGHFPKILTPVFRRNLEYPGDDYQPPFPRELPMPTLNALLLRMPATAGPPASAAGMSLRLTGGTFDFEPLFATQDTPGGLGAAAGGKQWYVARPRGSLDGANPWEVAHEEQARFSSAVGVATGAAPDLIEPDLLQSWPHGLADREVGLAAADACAFDDQNRDLPFRPGEFAWHLADSFSQLRKARSEAAHGAMIRIVHMDTGYDGNHATFPKDQIEKALQRNFVAGDNPNDARDPGNTGPLRNPGHGTGTLSILSGARVTFTQHGYQFDEELGGVLKARIVPVRVGNSVVQLTTSSVAKGIDYAASLCNSEATRVHVISMSMGGVASAAWADAVNKAYEAGIIYVAAAGNNFSSGFFGVPTHQIVYPARFRRVIAACGVMADRRPYYGLKFGTMQGNWGPPGAMATALSAFTPNIPWARWGCGQVVGLAGAGTSAATPQIAAAVALYLQEHFAKLFDRTRYPEPWMRVEAVRQAMFLAADKSADGGASEKLGNGILRAAAALDILPVDPQTLRKTPVDQAGFPFLNVLSGIGLTASPADQMLQLEATQLVQRWQRTDVPNPLELAVTDPDRPAEDVPPDQVRDFLEAVSEHPEASTPLKRRAKQVLDGMTPQRRGSGPDDSPPAPSPPSTPPPSGSGVAEPRTTFVPPTPPYRKLRSYAFDPSLSTTLDAVEISEITLKLPWEKLLPGPVGEYLEVIDVDPASKLCYEPVNLDDPLILAQSGLPPAEGVPQFHQQMVYAIASLTIANFERALGRKTLWRPGPPPPGAHPKDDSHYVQRLRVHPHALRDANAYYSPPKVALLFGYFNSTGDDPSDHLPGGKVFTCLSHDIVAHETSHALLDGMHRKFLLPSNPDVHAFHEGFADSVAMLQHFTFPEIVAHQIAATRGALDSQENLLVQLASQFGRATGRRMALRDAIGEQVGGVWQLRKPDPKEYDATVKPHDRGRILVSAVFDAFLSIYKRRTADLVRLATGGSGVLRPGAIHPDLVQRLAEQATKSAQHVLTMCIRALDYCPPTDITFGEYLRAIVTADYELVADDELNYRVSFVEAFRRRGIFPIGVRTLSVGSLLWRSPAEEDPQPSDALLRQLERLRDLGDGHIYAESREEIFHLQRSMRAKLHAWLHRHFQKHAEGGRDAAFLGLDAKKSFEVHTARIAFRASPDGGVSPQLLLGLLQSTTKPVDPDDPNGPAMAFEGGSTVVADLRTQKVRYCIRKHLQSSSRLLRQQAFALSEFDSLRATYLGVRSLSDSGSAFGKEPFALIHRG